MPFHNNYNPTSPNYFFHSNNNNLVVPSNTIHFTSDLYSPQKNEPGLMTQVMPSMQRCKLLSETI